MLSTSRRPLLDHIEPIDPKLLEGDRVQPGHPSRVTVGRLPLFRTFLAFFAACAIVANVGLLFL
jgi:hypothetical protein